MLVFLKMTWVYLKTDAWEVSWFLQKWHCPFYLKVVRVSKNDVVFTPKRCWLYNNMMFHFSKIMSFFYIDEATFYFLIFKLFLIFQNHAIFYQNDTIFNKKQSYFFKTMMVFDLVDDTIKLLHIYKKITICFYLNIYLI